MELQSALKGGRYGPVKRGAIQSLNKANVKRFKSIKAETNELDVGFVPEDEEVTAVKAKVSGQARATSLPSFKKKDSEKAESNVKHDDPLGVKTEHEAEIKDK